MATGIVKNVDVTGQSGNTQIVSFEDGDKKQGETLPFSLAAPGDLNPGDRISFDIENLGGSYQATNVSLVSTGTDISVNTAENLTISPTDTVIIRSGVTLTGTVNFDGGVLLVTGGSTVTGTINGDCGYFSVEESSSINQGCSLTGIGSDSFVSIKDSTTGGDVTTNSVKTTQVTGNTVNGDLSSTDDTTVTFSGNTVNGNLSIDNATNCKSVKNTVSGSNSGCPG